MVIEVDTTGDGVVATPSVVENAKLLPSNDILLAAEVVPASPMPNGADSAQKSSEEIESPWPTDSPT